MTTLLLAGAGLLSAGCLTMSVWGFEYTADDRGDREWEWCEEAWDKPDLAWWHRILLTPLTLAADCLTAPLQCLFFFDEDDCPCDHHSGRR